MWPTGQLLPAKSADRRRLQLASPVATRAERTLCLATAYQDGTLVQLEMESLVRARRDPVRSSSALHNAVCM
jgi:hypothetical protein